MPAFPVLELKEFGDKFLLDLDAPGLTKREYIAAKVISGLMAVNNKGDEFKNWDEAADEAVRVTVLVTDKLLLELSKPKP